jgi:NADPH:quinone reductase-like Zn-dependent oxidoreductase
MARIVHFHEIGGPEVLKLEEVEVAAPAADEVQVAVKAIGLNRAESMFRMDVYVETPKFPAKLGYEAAGIVEAGRRRIQTRRCRERHPAVIDYAVGHVRRTDQRPSRVRGQAP